MRRELFLPLVLMWGIGGCTGQIDDQLQRVDEEALKNWQAARIVIEAQMDAHETAENARAKYEEDAIAGSWRSYLDRHTGKDGRLYASTQPTTGPAVPLLKEDIEAVVNQRANEMMIARESHNKSLKSIKAGREIVIEYGVMIKTLTDQKATALEKRKSTTAMWNRLLETFSAGGAGAGIMAGFLTLL